MPIHARPHAAPMQLMSTQPGPGLAPKKPPMNPYNVNFWKARVRNWWHRQPPTQRHLIYRPAELSRLTGAPPPALPTVLGQLGWHRAVRWSRIAGRRVQRTYYSPPGHQVPRPRRGRPPVTLEHIFGIDHAPTSPFPQ